MSTNSTSTQIRLDNPPKPRIMTDIIKQNIGIDISKKDFAVCFSQLRLDGKTVIVGSRKFNNTFKGISKFIDWVEKKRVSAISVRFTMEATGIYYDYNRNCFTYINRSNRWYLTWNINSQLF